MIPNQGIGTNEMVTPEERENYVSLKVQKNHLSDQSAWSEAWSDSVQLHTCTTEDFDLMHARRANHIDKTIDKRADHFLCIDSPEDLTLQGFAGRDNR